MFGYTPQLLHDRYKRYKSTIGGLFCYIYLTCLLGYSIVQVVEYSSDYITGLTYEHSQNITAFNPGNLTDFNLAFGFVSGSFNESIGHWKVNHINRHWDSDLKSVKIPSEPYTVRHCNHSLELTKPGSD